jgi:hypothetical protein
VTLVKALNLSRIATLAVSTGRYFATKTRVYYENKEGVSSEVHDFSYTSCRQDWQAMGFMEGGEKRS